MRMKEASKYTGLHPHTLRKYIDQGVIKGVRLGKHRLARFEFEYLREAFASYGVGIRVVEENESPKSSSRIFIFGGSTEAWGKKNREGDKGGVPKITT